MRVSLRRVVKYATFLLIFVILNIWITYSVTLWTSAAAGGDNNKVRKSLQLDDGSTFHGVNRFNSDFREENHGLTSRRQNSFKTHFRLNNQRSAKSVYSDNDLIRSPKDINNFDSPPERIEQQVAGDDGAANNNNKGEIIKKQMLTPRAKKSRKLNSSDLQNASGITDVEDIHVSVKTTLKYHESRVKLVLKTWFRLASEETFFFTDGDDDELSKILGNHLINTNCSTDHSRRALSCKMAVEFDFYLASRKRWFCHVDDDVYVNIPQLVNLLQKYNHKEDWYLGKPSLKHPLEVVDRDHPGMKLAFWFATGGAGFCISRSLALKMAPYAGGGRFMTTAERIRLPDDCTLGYIIEYLLKRKLTVINEFRSHLEALGLIKLHMLKDQITFSSSEYSNKKNVINVPGFSLEEDPTRLKSLHCFLFPTFRECRGLNV